MPFAPNVLSVTVREPLGVVGAIIPWNVPMLLMALKVAPALVAGNTVVVKSAEEAPLAVLRICELMNRILPPGCFNMLSGFGPECGAPLVAHPLVRKVTFTGSVETGKIVARAAAEKLIPVTLELGGKSPMIVFADCDFDKTRLRRADLDALHPPGPELHRGVAHLSSSGRSSTASSPRMKAAVDAMVMGDPLDEKTDIGTIVSEGQLEKVRGFIEEGTQDGRRHGACVFRDADRSGAEEGPVHPARHLHRPRRRQPAGARGDLRPGHRHGALRRPRGGAAPRRMTANTAWPPRSGPTT